MHYHHWHSELIWTQGSCESTGRGQPSYKPRREAWYRDFPHSPQKEAALSTPSAWTSSLQTISMCISLFKPPGLYFIMAVLTNSHTWLGPKSSLPLSYSPRGCPKYNKDSSWTLHSLFSSLHVFLSKWSNLPILCINKIPPVLRTDTTFCN